MGASCLSTMKCGEIEGILLLQGDRAAEKEENAWVKILVSEK